MSNIFTEIARERAFEGYLESKDYQLDLIDAAETWIVNHPNEAHELFIDRLNNDYGTHLIILDVQNDIIEDCREKTMQYIIEKYCEEDVQERFMEEPCYDY